MTSPKAVKWEGYQPFQRETADRSPEGGCSQDAKGFEDQRACEEAETEGTADAWMLYISRHPLGMCVDRGQREVERLAPSRGGFPAERLAPSPGGFPAYEWERELV